MTTPWVVGRRCRYLVKFCLIQHCNRSFFSELCALGICLCSFFPAYPQGVSLVRLCVGCCSHAVRVAVALSCRVFALVFISLCVFVKCFSPNLLMRSIFVLSISVRTYCLFYQSPSVWSVHFFVLCSMTCVSSVLVLLSPSVDGERFRPSVRCPGGSVRGVIFRECCSFLGVFAFL